MKTKRIPTPRGWTHLEYHPYSEQVDFGAGIDIEALAAHMRKNGHDKGEPITICNNQILDGRHKHAAAQKAEIEPTFCEFVGTEEEALEYVRKKILRQHLDTSQRAMIAAKLAQHCPACKAAAAQQAEASLNPTDHAVCQWEKLRGRHWRALRQAVAFGRQNPDPLSVEELGRLVWSVLSPEHRPLLREVVLNLLIDDITDIALAVFKEVQHGGA